MKAVLFLIFFLCVTDLIALPSPPLVHPPVHDHPNALLPNHDVPPAPNPPNPYDPYGTIDGRPGSAFSDANAAAMHFINIVDNQVYNGAWLDAGGVVHDIMPQKVWAAGMHATRTHLGVAKARRVGSHRVKKSLQGGLVGEFMIIQYDTQFANKPNAVETVTLMMHGPLGLWKVISYQID